MDQMEAMINQDGIDDEKREQIEKEIQKLS